MGGDREGNRWVVTDTKTDGWWPRGRQMGGDREGDRWVVTETMTDMVVTETMTDGW